MRRLIRWLFGHKKKITWKYTCKDCGNTFVFGQVYILKDFGGLCHICNHLYKADLQGAYIGGNKLFGTHVHCFRSVPNTCCPCCGDPLITVSVFCDGRSWAEPAKFKFPEKEAV